MDGDAEDAEADPRVVRVFSGRLHDLPGLASKIVRIFTSSTFTDTSMERNALMAEVYPKIKEFCRERHGLEFQVVDMRWGVRDEATDDHMTTELCMNEIDNCQRLSMGPSFVVFLGQKYGYRPIPTIIPASELDMLREVIKDVKEDADILDTWYKRDDNAVPPIYILSPISSNLPNFNNKRHQRLMEMDQATWWETMGKLQRMLRKACQVLFLARKIDRDQMHHFFMSVTEREVRRGIINAKDTGDHTLAYLRRIDNVNMSALRFARNFVDVIGAGVDKEAEKLLGILRDEILPTKIPEENIARFTVEWTGKEGIDKDSHRDYLAKFCDHFYVAITGLVERAVVASRKLSSDRVYGEILQHLHACHNFCKIFQGRQEVVDRIHGYMCGTSDLPLILWGQSGCGKTSLLAKAYSMVVEWLGARRTPVLVLRFIGTSPDSSSLIPLLTSLCQQISFNYGQGYDSIPEDLSPLVQHLKLLLALATADRPLVLFLDSLDQLSGADGAHQLAWLPICLPPHVRVVVSTLPDYFGILDKLRKMVEVEENYVQVTPLGQNLGSTILTSWLTIGNRTVNDDQWKIVNEAIERCNLPLFVKLVFDEICRWRSYSPLKTTTLAHTIHDSIMKLFDRVENQHGKILVSHALGYVTAAKGGLSEAELEDVLSLDEKVLNDVYQYHLPPVRRIPPLLWTRIRNEMPNYFSEREADGVNVIFWYHRQFIEASRERYFRNLNFVQEMHSQMGDYFLGKWGGGRSKPFTYSDLQRQRFFLESTEGSADRKVPEQPLYFMASEGHVTRYNLRKLSEMPYHLLRAHRYEDVYKEVLFNFPWLRAKLSCMPLQSVLADFEDALAHVYDRDVKLLADALRLSASVLSRYPDMLGPQVTGRLLPYYSSHEKIQFLIQQCDSLALDSNALAPSYHCLHTPGGPLQYSLEGHPFAPFGIAITSDTRYLVSVSNLFIIWDLETGDVFRQIPVKVQGIMQNLSLAPDDKHAVSYTNNNQLVVCSVMTGEVRVLEEPCAKKEDIRGTAISNNHVAVWTAKQWNLYTLAGESVASENLTKDKLSLLHVQLRDANDERCVVLKEDAPIEGVESEDDMTLVVANSPTEDFYFHSAIAINGDFNIIYTCIEISDNNVACYKRKDGSNWAYGRTLGDNYDKVFSLMFSKDENYLVATVALAFKLWDLKTDKMLALKLPTGVRNIPAKDSLSSLLEFTKNSAFVVATVRKNIYVWDVKAGNLVKTLDAHFGRIIALTAVSDASANKVISSSIDKSIKVWNFDNILEDVFHIDRLEKPIEELSLAANAYVGATTTRNSVGVWNLESGRLMKTLANSQHSSIVTHSVITADATYVISAESGAVLTWHADRQEVLHTASQWDVQQLILTDEDTKVIALSKAGVGKFKVVCRSVPSGEEIYSFDYNGKSFKGGVVTCDGLFLLVCAVGTKKEEKEILGLYHAKTGTHMYNMTPKYPNYKDFSRIIAMPSEPNHIALIDPEKGNMWDVKKKSLVRSVVRWNGVCTSNGKLGLYAPTRGGLELLDLKTGKVAFTLIPRIAEGVFNVMTLFTKNDQHVVYYHSGRRTIRVFRVADGKQIANYKAHAEIKAIASTQGGISIVLGAVDGSIVVLVVADPIKEINKEFLTSLPSRQVSYPADEVASHAATDADGESGAANGRLANGATRSFGTIAQVARITAKAKMAQNKSKACVLS